MFLHITDQRLLIPSPVWILTIFSCIYTKNITGFNFKAYEIWKKQSKPAQYVNDNSLPTTLHLWILYHINKSHAQKNKNSGNISAVYIYTWRLNMPRAHTAINHVIGLFIYFFGFVSLTYQYRDHKLCLQTMAQFDTHVKAINLWLTDI